jgi:hypothetical protein
MCSLFGVALFVAAMHGSVVAGQATPDVPKPEACQVAPRSLPLLGAPDPSALAPTPAPLETAAPFAIPNGKPADAATVAAVTATVREAIACRNAGEFASAYALMSNRMLLQLFGGPATIDPEIADALASEPRRVPKDRRLALVAVSDVQSLADGRVGAIVETRTGEASFRDYLFFVAAGDRWLIDESVPLPEAAAADPA